MLHTIYFTTIKPVTILSIPYTNISLCVIVLILLYTICLGLNVPRASVLIIHSCQYTLGVYFDNVNSTELEYTVRLRQEVGSRDSWQTRQTAAVFDLPGPRTNPKYAICIDCSFLLPVVDAIRTYIYRSRV